MGEKGDLSFTEAAAAVFGELPGLLASLDDHGLADDLSHALDEEEESFRPRVPDLPFPWYGGMLLVELEWIDSGASLWTDFYRLLGRIAEETLLVHQTYESDSIVFEVVTGRLKGEASHAHHVRFRLIGPRVELDIARFHAAMKDRGPSDSPAPS
jgi:hypothetical protein